MDVTSNFSGVVHTVGADKDYTDIDTALSNADPGDVLLIDPGDHQSTIVLNSQVHLVGNTDDVINNPVRLGIEANYGERNVTINIDSVSQTIGNQDLFIENIYFISDYNILGRSTDCIIRCNNSPVNIYVNKCNVRQNSNNNSCFIGTIPEGYKFVVSNSRLYQDPVGGYYAVFFDFYGYYEIKSCYHVDGILYNDSDTPALVNKVTTPTFGYGVHYGTNYYSEFYIDGYVVVQGRPVERTVRLYRRSNGRLISETVSDRNNNGYFWFALPNKADYFYFIVLDNLNHPNVYNAKIVDKIRAHK